MRFAWLVVCLVIPVRLCAFTPDWGACVKSVSPEDGSVSLSHGGFTARLSASPAQANRQLKAEVKNGWLEVDTRGLEKGTTVIVQFRAGLMGTAKAGERFFFEIEANGAPPGSMLGLLFEGAANKKHYWTAQRSAVIGVPQTLRTETVLPPGLEELHLRIDISSPGVFAFKRAFFGRVRDEE